MGINEIRERINLVIYDSKKKALSILNIFSFIIALIAILTMMYLHGWSHTELEEKNLFFVIQISFAFYIFRYFIRIFYDFNPIEFIKTNWMEGIIIFLLMIDAVLYNTTGELLLNIFFENLHMPKMRYLTGLFLQLYILSIVFVDLKRDTLSLPKIRFNPATIFVVTFFILIIFGSGLLMMPEMTTQVDSMSFIDAIFTATSAACVTGLSTVDTGTFFTFKGHFVILILMKLGGLNIISFGSFLAFFGKFGVGIKHHDVLEDFMFKDSIFSSRGMLAKIITGSIVFEIIGATFIFWVMSQRFPNLGIEDRMFFSIFHSVSAFNNAGFSIITDGMYNEMYKDFFLLHLILAGLIFIGALGFDTFFDLFSKERMQERLKYQWKRPRIGSLLNVYTSVFLTIFGAVLFLIFESSSNMVDYSSVDKVITSLFQSITLRTAGFSTLDFYQFSVPVLIMSMVFMFIGGGSSSTAGGIKTSTFAIMVLSAYSTIRGKKNIEVFKRTISQELVFRAFSVFMFSLTSILIGAFFLSITESHILGMEGRGFIDLLFEEVSAFATVGLSTGITSALSVWGKIILIISMFIGRVGTLTVAFAVSKTILSTNYKYPNEHMLVG